ncbi:MAG: flagellar biosynthetic protein FliR [Rhodothalassiaceae bacterium]|nr:MAG: flagellar biosynthetic protein FliR [Rhodothalassiaceae bacterium]
MPDFGLPDQIFHFFLVLARIGAIFAVAPALGEAQIPMRIRAALALAVSLLLLPVVTDRLPALPEGAGMLAWLIGRESLIGLMLAGAARLILSALHVAGTVVAFQAGLAFTQQFDPTQGTQSAVTASFMTFLGITLIFATDLHHLVIAAVFGSYDLLPASGPLPAGDFADLVTRLVAISFTLGLKLAAPFLVFGIVFNLGMGLLARVMPQLPVFFVALPANILLSFVILLIVLPAMMLVFMDAFADAIRMLSGG